MGYGKIIRLTDETTVIDFSVDADFTPVIDFGVQVQLLAVYVPTIDTGTVNVHVCIDDPKDEDVTPTNFVVAATDILGGSGTGAALGLLDAATDVVGFRHFQIETSADQTADRTFILWAREC